MVGNLKSTIIRGPFFLKYISSSNIISLHNDQWKINSGTSIFMLGVFESSGSYFRACRCNFSMMHHVPKVPFRSWMMSLKPWHETNGVLAPPKVDSEASCMCTIIWRRETSHQNGQLVTLLCKELRESFWIRKMIIWKTPKWSWTSFASFDDALQIWMQQLLKMDEGSFLTSYLVFLIRVDKYIVCKFRVP